MIAGMTDEISGRILRRVRNGGAEPFLTYYDTDSGERTELSAVSFRNWVDKTANLLVDELEVEAGDVIGLPLALEAPTHWVTFVWEVACWQVGALVDVSGVDVAGPPAGQRVRVLGPLQAASLTTSQLESLDGVAVLACSLHPLGLGFADAVPAPMIDFSLEVRAQPDAFVGVPVESSVAAWTDDTTTVDQNGLVGIEVGSEAVRGLLMTTDPWDAVREGVLRPLLDGGSTVVVVGHDLTRLERIRSDERVQVDL